MRRTPRIMIPDDQARPTSRAADPTCSAVMRPGQSPALSHDIGFSEEAEVQAEQLLPAEELVPGYLLDSGEIVILAIKPSIWFLVVVSVEWLFAAAALILLAPMIVEWLPSISLGTLTQGVLLVTTGRLLVALLQWSSRLYVLTNRRVMSYRGVLNVSIFEAPLIQIRNTYVNIGRAGKILQVGSIGFSLKGAKHVNAWWDQIANPTEVHARVRRAIERALDGHNPF